MVDVGDKSVTGRKAVASSTDDTAEIGKLVRMNEGMIQLLYEEMSGLIKKRCGYLWSVILFDEIEKSHDSLRNFLLEITSKGRASLQNLIEQVEKDTAETGKDSTAQDTNTPSR